jgi:hypothetical protein
MLLLESYEISASSWFYYKEICYDAARSHERKIFGKCVYICYIICLYVVIFLL